jgi:predicted molibdopterin-dependent oxidoreductase YjgC
MPGTPSDPTFAIYVDGQAIPARPGQTLAAVLLAAGCQTFRYTRSGKPRGIFCGMGACFDCLVTVDGLADQRACMTPAQPGMQVQTGTLAGGPPAGAGGGA